MKLKTNYIYIFLLAVVLVSCNSEKRIARLQAKYCDKTEHTDTVVTILIDTVVNERIILKKTAPNPDTLMMFAQAYCDSNNNAQMREQQIIYKQHKANIVIVNDTLKAEVICNTDSLVQLIKEKNILIKELTDKTVTNEKFRYKEVKTFYKHFSWIIITLFISVFIIYLIVNVLKR